mmetsp:Transcript_33564/g.45341  ORF Transcript_33564/g.45341 Transcript_33564/m.45341 type:complete len:86 (-) Transcript_33564:2002-2259(-)
MIGTGIGKTAMEVVGGMTGTGTGTETEVAVGAIEAVAVRGTAVADGIAKAKVEARVVAGRGARKRRHQTSVMPRRRELIQLLLLA